MRKLFCILFVSITLSASATEALLISKNYKNVHFQSGEVYSGDEVFNKCDLFFDLIKQLFDSKKYDNPVLIRFINVYDKKSVDSIGYSVSYAGFEYRKFDRKCKTCEHGYDDGRYNDTGIVIEIRDKGFKVKEYLQLINSALENIDYIKQHQKQQHLKTKWRVFDELRIAYKDAYSFSQRKDTSIDRVSKERKYCQFVGQEWSEVYYYQDNKFHIQYLPWSISNYMDTVHTSEISGPVFQPNKGLYSTEDALITNNIIQINSTRFGDFVFVSDSTFYFLPYPKAKPKGPMVIHDLLDFPFLLAQFECFDYPAKYIVITTETWHNKKTAEKILYAPDSNLFVADYDSIENESIKQLFHRKPPSLLEVQITYTRLYLFAFVLLVMIFSVFYIGRKSKT